MVSMSAPPQTTAKSNGHRSPPDTTASPPSNPATVRPNSIRTPRRVVSHAASPAMARLGFTHASESL